MIIQQEDELFAKREIDMMQLIQHEHANNH